MLQSLIDNWLGWLGLGATAATVVSLLSWVPGVGVALRIGASLLEMLSPLINGVLSGVIWIWKSVLLPGLLDILDSIATILTVVSLVGSMFVFMKLNDDIRYNNLQRQCQAIKQKRPPEDVPQEPLWEFKLPWQW